jgi:hypothetical protein
MKFKYPTLDNIVPAMVAFVAAPILSAKSLKDVLDI